MEKRKPGRPPKELGVKRVKVDTRIPDWLMEAARQQPGALTELVESAIIEHLIKRGAADVQARSQEVAMQKQKSLH